MTRQSEVHSVAYGPIEGTVKLARSEPSVGSPPVKANQTQPTAAPRLRAGVAAVSQLRKPYANSG